jgi:hypothetical protein
LPTKRTIRRITPAVHHEFDEQLWPVNIALLVLSGFVGGLIIAYSDFVWHSEDWWRNGYVRLASLIASVGLFIWLSIWLGGQRGRRFQLAAVLSIFLHALLGWQLFETKLSQQVAVGTPTKEATPSFVEHTYQPDALAENAPLQDFEKPIEVLPEQQKPEPVARVATQPIAIKQPQPLVEPDKVPPKPTETPQTVVARIEFAAPKRAPEQSKLSRSETTSPKTALDNIKTTPQPVKAAAPQPSLQAQSTPRERAAEMPAVNPNAQAPAPTATPEPLQIAAANPRAQQSTEQTTTNRAAQLPRANNTPQNIPSAQVTEPTPVAKGSDTSPLLTANASNTAKSAATPNLNQPEISRDTTASNTPSPAPAPTKAPPRPDSTAIARADGPAAPARQTNNAPSPIATQAENVQAPGSSSAPSQNTLAANSSSTERSNTTAAVIPTNSPAPANETPSASNAPGAVNVAAAPRTESAAAGAAPSRASAPTGLGNRPIANRQAQAIAESIRLPSLAGESSGAPSEQLGGPATTAVTTRNALTPGQGATPNLSSSWSDSNPSQQPLAGASQRVATTTAAGNAAAPSRETLTRAAGTTSGNIAANTDIALDVPNAAVSGGATAAPLNATASAASARADSRAAVGPVAAAAGSANVDTGNTSQVTGTQATPANAARGSGSKVELATGRDAPKRNTLGGGSPLAQNDTRAADIPNGGSSAAGSGQPGNGSGQAPLQASATGGTRGERQASLGGSALALASGEPGGGGSGTPTGTASVANPNSTGSGTIAGSGAGLQIGRTSNGGTSGAATTAADIAPVAGTNGNGGNPDGIPGAPLAATSSGLGRQTAGLPGPVITAPLGAVAGDPSDGAPASSLGSGTLAAPIRASGTGGTEQLVAMSGGNLARSRGATIGAGTDTADLPSLPTTGETGAPAAALVLQPGGLTGPTTAKSRQSVNVQVAVTSSDSGGLGDHYTLKVGSVLPQARQESQFVSNTAARFLNRTSSGASAIDGQVREVAPAFAKRLRNSNLEAEIELGLKFVAAAQDGDGSWNLRLFPGANVNDIGQLQSPTAATGLALLSFLGAGYDHFGEDYQKQVAGGLAYLVANQRPDGDLYVTKMRVPNDPAWLYSHGIATIALCEAYGMTSDEKLREPAQRAINFIEKAQDKQLGGWRYQPGSGADTSVTGWQIMALKSGELAKLKVNPQTYVGVRKWLDAAEAKGPGKNQNDAAQYVYDPNAIDDTRFVRSHGRTATPATTSMGLLMRMYLGWDKQNPDLKRGAEFLLDNPPQLGTAAQKKRDTYYWYYASQVMYHMQGDAWRDWNLKLRPLLLNSQAKTGVSAGSWDPGGAVPDKWGAHGGRLYVTTMNLLSLEVSHRYLPIYDTIGEKK